MVQAAKNCEPPPPDYLELPEKYPTDPETRGKAEGGKAEEGENGEQRVQGLPKTPALP